MKKRKSAARSSAAGSSTAKDKRAPKTVSEYFARVPRPARATCARLRSTIRSAVPPEATETISYGIPAFKLDQVFVWYAAFANHCSLFPTASVIAVFKNELKGFSTSKGTIHFPIDKPLPVALIAKLVQARVLQSEAKKSR
jgi:uncharacterized protein YdhG (YjbR/CyaY superfamily)